MKSQENIISFELNKKLIKLYLLTFTFPFTLLIVLSLSICTSQSFCQIASVGINKNGVSPNVKALLDIDATGLTPKAGLLIPRMTTDERNAITSPIPESLIIYNIDSHCYEAYYDSWVACGCLNSVCQPPKPSIPGVIDGQTSVNAGNTYTFSINPIANAVSYTWSLPCNGTIISGQGTTSINVSFTYVSSSLAYTNPGNYTIDCVKNTTIEVVGAGGTGGGDGGGGGGGGGYARATYSGLNDRLSITIGAGGSGTTTSVGSIISATAGANGYIKWTSQTDLISYGGDGGIGNVGKGINAIIHSGGKGGGNGNECCYVGGGGGGAAGPNSNGSNGTEPTPFYPKPGWGPPGCGGSSGGSPGGGGGNGAGYTAGGGKTILATSPGIYGGGGGGGNGTSSPASKGADGFCRIISITYGGIVSVSANNVCGSSSPRILSVTINP